ncbi:MAG: anthranilate phosphoribosyltransferase, partial [Candidatus Azobacteroides sp.]|nr:anthranilate phosphoribosyltransferase [Candidatus Azobacteroides sp.]
GVYDLKMLRLYNYIYQQSDCNFSIVHSLDGYDEISLTDKFKVINSREERMFEPEMTGMKRVNPEELFGGDTPAEAARIFDRVLNNTATESQKNVVVVNAAIAIQTIAPNRDFQTCIEIANESLASGKAKSAFIKFKELNS